MGILCLGLTPALAATPAAAEPLLCPPIGGAYPMLLPRLASTDAVTPGTVLTGVKEGAVYGDVTIEQVAWYRDDAAYAAYDAQAISWDSSTYMVTTEDIGTSIQQVAKVIHNDFNPCFTWSTGASSPSVAVKARSTLRLRTSDPRGTKPPRVTIKISQQGAEPVRGFVTITWKGPKNGSEVVRVAKPSGAAVTATLPSLHSGSYTVRGAFTDISGRAMPSASPTARLRVRQ